MGCEGDAEAGGERTDRHCEKYFCLESGADTRHEYIDCEMETLFRISTETWRLLTAGRVGLDPARVL